VLQDANFNTLGVVSRTGRLIERYEYTPYGQRTVFSHGWLAGDCNDDGEVDLVELGLIGTYWGKTNNATLEEGDMNGDGAVGDDDLGGLGANWGKSVAYLEDPGGRYTRLGRYVATPYNPMGLCDGGHQGLFHDREFGLVYNRMRYFHPTLARFTSRDPLMYVDGMSMYEYCGSTPLNRVDPNGLWFKDWYEIQRLLIKRNGVWGYWIHERKRWGGWYESEAMAYGCGQHDERCRFEPDPKLNKPKVSGSNHVGFVYRDPTAMNGYDAEEILAALPSCIGMTIGGNYYFGSSSLSFHYDFDNSSQSGIYFIQGMGCNLPAPNVTGYMGWKWKDNPSWSGASPVGNIYAGPVGFFTGDGWTGIEAGLPGFASEVQWAFPVYRWNR